MVFRSQIAEKEALAREKEELLIQVEEVTETLERQETEHRRRGHEHGDTKKRVEQLILELSTALASVADHKKRGAEREHELEHVRTELNELRTTASRRNADHDKTKTELESLYIKLKTCEDDRDSARSESERHHSELRNLLREHTDLKSNFADTSTKFEFSRKEVLSLTDRIKTWELERDELLHEKDRLHEDLKRAKLRADDSSREFAELTERYDRVQRNYHKVQESVRIAETERDALIENLRREVKAKAVGWEEAEERYTEINLKYEHVKREAVAAKEKFHEVELERNELRDSIDRSRDEHRRITFERDQHKQDLDDERRRVSDGHRRIATLEESIRRAEHTVAETRTELHTLTERNQILHREGEEHRGRHTHLSGEISALQDKITLLQTEIRNLTHARDATRADLDAWRHKYEEITETVTSYDESSAEFEFEIDSLRTLLREAREQKERAITARHTADRERDEFIAKYEEKCREMERFEESASSHWHLNSKSGGGGKSVTRTVSSGTTLHHDVKQGGDEHHHHHHQHEGGNGGGFFN